MTPVGVGGHQQASLLGVPPESRVNTGNNLLIMSHKNHVIQAVVWSLQLQVGMEGH